MVTTRTTRTTRKPDAASPASRRSETGRMVSEYNQEDYELVQTDRWPDYFRVGKILAHPLGTKHKGVRLYRRGIIVESFETYSTLLQIKTNGGSGCLKLKEEQKTHSAIYVGSRSPSTKQEPSLRVAIQASRLDVQDSKNPRINYNAKFYLNHTVKVREVGQVSGRHLEVLLEQYREVHDIAQEITAAPSPNLPDPPDAKPTSCVEDREDSWPQRNGDKHSVSPAEIQPSDLAAVHSLEGTLQTQQQPKEINSAATPQTLPNEPAGGSEAPPLLSNDKLTPPTTALKANANGPLLQDTNTKRPKTPQNDAGDQPVAPPPVDENSESVLSAGLPPKPEQYVKPTHDDPSTEPLHAGTTPATVAIESSLPEATHLTPTEAICLFNDTISEEVTSAVDLSLSQTANTVSPAQPANLGMKALPQVIGTFELRKETTRPTQETNNSVQDLAKEQDMRHAFGYTILSFPLKEMVTSLHVLPLTAYTSLLQMMDVNLPEEPEKHARAPLAAGEKDKQRAEGGIPHLHLLLSILTLLLLPLPPLLLLLPPPLHLMILAIWLFSYLSENRVTWFHPTRPDASMPPRLSARSLPQPDWWRWIWLQDEGLKSKIQVCALLDTGADDNFISEQALQWLDAKIDTYHNVVTCGNGQKQEVHGAVRLQFSLTSQPKRWEARFIVAAGLPHDVVFGRPLITRLEFFKVNPEMLVLTLGKNGKPDEKAIREAERQREQHDRQVEELNEREREEMRARRAQTQHQKRA